MHLANSYRPTKMSHFAGNSVAVSTISGFIINNNMPHVLLFEGPVGCGKTSMGRLVSMRLNCTEVDANTVDPCGRCESCRSIISGDHPCHIEINASDNRKLDDIRKLIKLSKYSPAGGKHRVIMLDEPHGIIKEGQNALLMPLENPPKSTTWIFCTSEPGKLIDGIRSRSRAGHIKLSRVDHDELAKHIYVIGKKEGIKLTKSLATRIATITDGHPRDALGVLESVIAYVKSSNTTGVSSIDESDIESVVNESVSTSPWVASMNILASAINGDVKSALTTAASCDAAAEIVIGFMATHVTQLLYHVNGIAIGRSHAWWVKKVKIPTSNIGNIGECVNAALETSKNHLCDDKLLVATTICRIHAIAHNG